MIYSFSFLALDAGLHKNLPENVIRFDVRELVDPAPLRLGATGKDKRVSDFVLRQPLAKQMMEQAIKDASDNDSAIAFGCVGGIYRSVAMAQHLSSITGRKVKHLGLELYESGVKVWELEDK